MKKTIIIAEAGVNHNGDVEKAIELIRVAKDSGADFVKFQTFKTANCISQHAPLAEYQKENVPDAVTQVDMIRKLELSEKDHDRLFVECKRNGIAFLSTAFDLESLQFLKRYNFLFYKVASGEVTNYPLLKAMGNLRSKIVLSTGMATVQEIEAAISVLISAGTAKQDITVLHCNTEYPSPFADINLHSIPYLKQKLGMDIGYSDHTEGIEASIAAVALGATVIEKHFTLDKSMEGPDHKASLSPAELKAMVRAIRNIEVSLGELKKEPSNSERKNISIARKSIVASCEIKKGDVFSEQNITTKRPGSGMSPMIWEKVIGQKATKDYRYDDLINEDCS